MLIKDGTEEQQENNGTENAYKNVFLNHFLQNICRLIEYT
jgi:hypothetical protein